MPWNDEDLFKCLRDDFGSFGERTVSFLKTSRQLLEMAPRSVPGRIPEAAIYCVREALKEIPKSTEVEADRVSWAVASRGVAAARDRYQMTVGVPGADEESALREMLRSISVMEEVHEQTRIHQGRLITMMIARSGMEPLGAIFDPISDYQRLIDQADSSLHSSATLESAWALLGKTTALMARFFLSPDIRYLELEKLALVENPTAADVDRLVGLVSTAIHLHQFFRHAVSGDWPTALDEVGLVTTPEAGPWPIIHFVGRLEGAEQQKVLGWLTKQFGQWKRSRERCVYLMQAALASGVAGHDLLLGVLRRHPGDATVAHLAAASMADADAHSAFVTDVADSLLSDSSGIGTYIEHVLEPVVAGLDDTNWSDRVRLLVYKLRDDDPNDRIRFFILGERAGSIADPIDLYRSKRFAVLLRGLIRCVSRSIEAGTSIADLRAATATLPADIGIRLEPWLLGITSSTSSEELAGEVGRFIETRSPCGDDLVLIDRVMAEENSDEYIGVWRAALGDPPTSVAVAKALREGSLEERWFQVRSWSAALPRQAWSHWASALTIIEGPYGAVARSMLQHRVQAGVGSGRSPMSQSEINGLMPAEAAHRIAAWRPQPSDFLVSARELARAMEADVADRPREWLKKPIEILSALRHPTYIAHYFMGAAAVNPTGDEVGDLTEAMSVAIVHPWEALPLGRDSFEYDSDWSGVDGSVVELMKKLADTDVLTPAQIDWARNIVAGFIDDRSQPSGLQALDTDPLESAVNRYWTLALQALHSLMACRFRLDGVVDEAAFELLEEVLALDGQDGAQGRAIIAPRFGFLLHIAPDWVARRKGLLFGDEAPGDLGQLTVNQALKWAPPHPWILEHERAAVVEAVKQGLDRALWAMLLGMVWGVNGYVPTPMVDELRQIDEALISESGEALGRMLSEGTPESEHMLLGTDFWRSSIDCGSRALQGFGWWSEVSSLDQPTWLDLTQRSLRQTGGQMDWSHEVAARAAGPVSAAGLDILHRLVLGLPNAWDRDRVMKISLEALGLCDETLRGSSEFRVLRNLLIERGLDGALDV